MTDQRPDGAVNQQVQDLEITQKVLQLLDYEFSEPEEGAGVDPYNSANSVLADAGGPWPKGPAR